MEWLEGIFDHSTGSNSYRWDSKHAPRSGSNRSGYGRAPGDEKLDHAVAFSLYEDYRRKDTGGHTRDGDLARALQESLNFNGACPHANSAPVRQVSSTHRLYCGGCRGQISDGQKSLSCAGAAWHPQCLRCQMCNVVISGNNFLTWGRRPYHHACYNRLSFPKCDVCKNYVPANSAGMIEYRVHPFWKQKYCPAHETDGSPRCCSCDRMESKDTQSYASLTDGRKLCLECLSSAILDTGECQPLYHAVREFYEGLNMKIQQEIPMLLVEMQALNEAKEGEKGWHNMPVTRGLCLSEERTVSTVIRRPTMGARNRMADLRTGSARLTRHCEVTAILVLYGLPRLLTGAVLAHELMHAWLRLNGFRNLKPEVEEGICQVMAHMWLEAEVMAGLSNSNRGRSSMSGKSKAPRSGMEKQLGEFFLQQIAKDSSPIYGRGFQRGYASMVQYDLRQTIDHIRLMGEFPL